MNREIKFRGLTTNNNVMVFGDLIHTPDNDCRIIWYGSNYPFTYNEKVVPNTIGQYTGFKDKNDVEIYDGDILKNPLHRNRVVVWFEKGFYAQSKNNGQVSFIPLSVGFLKNKEVVGNIHQNPELLKQ